MPVADTLYVADDSAGGGIQKWSLVSGAWVLNGTITGTTVRVDNGQHLVPLARDVMFVVEELFKS